MSFVYDTDCCRSNTTDGLCQRCRQHFGLTPAPVGNGDLPPFAVLARRLELLANHTPATSGVPVLNCPPLAAAATPDDTFGQTFNSAAASPLHVDPATGRLVVRNLSTPIPPPGGGDMITRMRQLDLMLRRDADDAVLRAVAGSDAGLLAEALSRLEAVGDADGPAATRIKLRLEQLRSATVAANGMDTGYLAPSTLAVDDRGPLSPLESGEMTPSVVDWSDASGLTEDGRRVRR